MPSSMLHLRVNEKDKREAAMVAEKIGISLSDVLRITLRRVAVEKAIPFAVRVPNAVTERAMRAAERKRGSSYRSSAELFERLGLRAPKSRGAQTELRRSRRSGSK